MDGTGEPGLLVSAVLSQPEGKESKRVDLTGTPEPKGGDFGEIDWDAFSTTPEAKGAKGVDGTGDSMDMTGESMDGTGEPGEKGSKGAKGSDDDDIDDIIEDILDAFNITLPGNMTVDDLIDTHDDHVHGQDHNDTDSYEGLGNSVAAYGVFTSLVMVAVGMSVTMF